MIDKMSAINAPQSTPSLPPALHPSPPPPSAQQATTVLPQTCESPSTQSLQASTYLNIETSNGNEHVDNTFSISFSQVNIVKYLNVIASKKMVKIFYDHVFT